MRSQVNESVSGQAQALNAWELKWAKSVGNIAAPLLAGFSLTSVIVISEDPTKFRWSDAAILSLAIAAVTLIFALQTSKYVRKEYPRAVRWYGRTRINYHTGIVALLLGLGFALAPLHVAGSPDAPRWVACVLVFAASLHEAVAFTKRYLVDAIRKSLATNEDVQ
jgi:hypothetical protein